MPKSVEEVRRESIRFSNDCINNELRKRLTQNICFDEVRELEFIETRIQQTKSHITYYYGGFALEPDVIDMINQLRRKCVNNLRRDAAFELSCYDKRAANGENPKSIEYLRTSSAAKTEKANSIQATLDRIEEEKKCIAKQEKEKKQRKAALEIKYRKICIFGIPIILIVGILFVLLGPKTVASGNGYKYQIGSFGSCEISDCGNETSHRIHHFFGNQNYCDSHWDSYGQNMFERLSRTENNEGIGYDENKCRHSSCNKKAKYSNWDRRYCAEHLRGTKYCRYPGCIKELPIDGLYDYCTEHR